MLLVVLALSTPPFALVQAKALSSGLEFLPGHVYPVGPQTLAGGIIFGFGMVIAGGCAAGTLVRSGDGFTAQWAALAGLCAGSVLGAWHWDWWHPVIS